jgi:hypothetical protein
MKISDVRALAPEVEWSRKGTGPIESDWGFLELRYDGRYHAEPWYDHASGYVTLDAAVSYLRAAGVAWKAMASEAERRLLTDGWATHVRRGELEARRGEARMIVRPLGTTLWADPRGDGVRGRTWREALRAHAAELRARAAELEAACDE